MDLRDGLSRGTILNLSLLHCLLQVAKDAVVVEADAIKNKDVVYQQLNRRLSRMGRSTSDLSKYVHEYSTKAAESMFVAAINQQRVRTARSQTSNSRPS